jgi:hypothetical protein
MGQAHQPTPVKLMVSLLSGHSELFGLAERALVERFGPIDYAGPLLPFAHTDYYAAEFGADLLRRIVTLEELIDPGILADVKTWTNALEWQLAEGERRRINLAPATSRRANWCWPPPRITPTASTCATASMPR